MEDFGGETYMTEDQKKFLVKLVIADGNTLRKASEIANINENISRKIICEYKREVKN